MATLCVGPTATGSGNGADWSNMMVPPSNGGVRGNTYYFADGTGSGYTANFVFSTANSGTTTITWKKATIADHGTATGWSDTYGDGQAVFNPSSTITWEVRTSYWIFDGTQGAMNYDGTVATTFGFRVNATDNGGSYAGVHFVNGNTPTDVTFKYIEGVGAGYGSTSASRWFQQGVSGGTSNLNFQHLYIHDCGQMWLYFAFQSTTTLVEYCYFQNVGSGSAGLHSAGIFTNNFNSASSAWTFRYNTLEGMVATGATGYIVLSTASSPGAGGFDLYGNIFKDPNNRGGGYLIGNASSDVVSSGNIYNNTIYGFQNSASLCGFSFVGSATMNVKNNLWQGCTNTPTIVLIGSGALTTATNILNTSNAAAFVSAATGNFHLSSDTTTSWTSQSSPYNVDPDGVTRTSSVGAFQYASGPTLSSATIDAAGTSMTVVLSASCTTGAGGSGGMKITIAGTDYAGTYASGSGSTTYVFTVAKVYQSATATVTYTQPGNGIEATTGGADVASFAAQAVTNNSTQAIPVPTSPSATKTGQSTIDVGWTDASSGVTAFNIYRSLTNGSFVFLASVAAGVVIYHDTGLAAGTQYYYTVASTAQGLTSSQTSSVNATTDAAVASWHPALRQPASIGVGIN